MYFFTRIILIFQSFIDFFYKLPRKNLTLLAAVSGGADSVALFHLLHRNRSTLCIRGLAAVHVNHGLRGIDADLDEQLVRSMADSLSVPLFTKKLTGITLESSGLEEFCRSERYAFFHQLKKNHNFDFIVTAHTADDQAETLLMRIIRGCGIRGLAGVHEVRGDAVIRPLLGITKKELVLFLKENGIPWREDHSNNDLKFLRNNIRHNVLPMLETLNPQIREHLVTLGKSAAAMLKIVELNFMRWKATSVLDESESHFEICRDGFTDVGVAEYVLRMLSDRGIECSNQKIIHLIDNSHATSGRILISDGWSMYGARNSVIFLKEGFRIPVINEAVEQLGETKICNGLIRINIQHSDTFEKNTDKNTVYVDSAFLNESLLLRTVESGDRFIPFGRKNEVAVLSFLESQGYSKIDRERMAVLSSGHNIVWIPGIRLSDSVKVTNSTKHIIKISFQLHAHIL